jgi:hypothetical protein
MAVVADVVDGTDGTAALPPGLWRARLVPAALVALVASPVVIAALSIAGDPWLPVGDWASMVYRTSRVGTSDTPLVGAYTTKGWAHPGPLLFWLASPLFRLTGGDPRALGWTAAGINVATIAALAAVAWRRGRWALTVGVMGLTAVLVHAIGPELLVDLWNPHAPLLPFLLTVVLVWDAALGRRRALVEAAIPACFAVHAHLAFVSLVGLLAVWLWAWSRWWPCLLPADGAAGAELPRAPWSPWWRAVRRAVGVFALLSVGPLLDSLFDMHNPLRIVRSFGGDDARLGPIDAVGLVGRYVRPDGPWMGGPAPLKEAAVQGSGPLPVLLALAVLAGCLHVARKRGLVDVTALSCLALSLLLGAIPAASQFVPPVERYLAQWLKLVGGLVWFTLAWTAWRLAEPAVRAVPRRTLAAGSLAGVALVGATAWSWGAAWRAEPQFPDEGEIVHELGAELAAVLPDDRIIRVERRGEPWHIFTPGLIYDLIERGVRVTTSEGESGLKWGHEHRWVEGEPFDMLITVAVHDPGSWHDAVTECARSSSAELIASYDALAPEDRAWLEDFKLRRWSDADGVTPGETARGDRLEANGLRIAVYDSPLVCAQDRTLLEDDDELGE